MPGVVAAAAPTTVLPKLLCSAFAQAREYSILENTYRMGESQRKQMTASSRKSWKLSRLVTPTQLSILRDFLVARNYGTEPFYLYDPMETTPYGTYDATGVQTSGRFTVVMRGPWSESVGIARSQVSLELVEVS